MQHCHYCYPQILLLTKEKYIQNTELHLAYKNTELNVAYSLFFVFQNLFSNKIICHHTQTTKTKWQQATTILFQKY